MQSTVPRHGQTFATTERIRSPFKRLRLAELAYIMRQSEEINKKKKRIPNQSFNGGLP